MTMLVSIGLLLARVGYVVEFLASSKSVGRWLQLTGWTCMKLTSRYHAKHGNRASIACMKGFQSQP